MKESDGWIREGILSVIHWHKVLCFDNKMFWPQ